MKPIHLITLISTLNHVVFVAARFTIMLFAIHLGASPTSIGVLGALFAALSSVTLVSVGRWADHVGSRVPMLGFSLALILCASLPFFWQSLPALFIAATLVGWISNSFWVCSQQLVGRISTSENRAANYGIATLGLAVSSFVGPVIAGFSIDRLGHPQTLLLFSLLPIIPAAIIALNIIPFPPGRRAGRTANQGTVARPGVFSLLRIGPLRNVFVVGMTLAASWDFYTFLMPIYGVQLRLSASTTGMLFGAFTAGVIVIRFFMPLLSRHFAPWRLLLSALAVAGLCYALIPLAAGVAMLMAVALILGMALGIQLPVSSALLYENSPPERGGEAIGLRVMLASIGATILPLLAGALIDLAGVFPVFLLVATMLFITLRFYRHLWNARAAAGGQAGR